MKVKNLVLAAIGALTSLAGITGMTPVMAQTFNGEAIYKDALNNIYLAPGSSNVSVRMALTGVDVRKAVNSDRCGVFSLRFPTGTEPSTVNIGGSNTTLSGATVVASKQWTCNPTTGAIVPRLAGVTVPSNSAPIVQVGGTYYFYYSTPLTTYLVSYAGSQTKTVKINACGFGTLPYTASQQFPATATIGPESGTPAPVAMSALGVAPGKPVCSNGQLLLPAGWTN